MSNVNALDSVLKFLTSKPKSYEDLAYDPVFKSSAMFPIMCGGDLSVSFSFMNYWKYKNHIDNVSCLLTVRDQRGGMVSRTYFKIDQDVYRFKFPDLVRDLLDGQDMFVGSVEFEFHSTEDLKFPYPAITIFYESETGVSAVHTAGRVFHSIGDMDLRLLEENRETGFDIYSAEHLTPFISFTNGPRPVKKAKVFLTAFNHLGDEQGLQFPCGDLNSYETVFIFPDQHFELKDFLQDKVGFCKVRYDSFGIFPRLLCGNTSRDFSQIAITHSYYDLTGREEYFAIAESGDTRSPFRAIPLLFDEGVEADLNFYPIYSPGQVHLSAQFFNVNGKLLAKVDGLGTVRSPDTKLLNLRVRDILEKAEVPLDQCSLLSIECASDSGKVPTRINYGLNYYTPGRPGTNINLSMNQDAEYVGDKRSYRWLPVFLRRDLSNRVLVSALSNKNQDSFVAEVQLAVFSEGGEIYSGTINVENQTSKTLRLEEILVGCGYESSEGEILWCILESECPHIEVYYLMQSERGQIGGDHSY